MGKSVADQLEAAIRKAGTGKVMLDKAFAGALLATLRGRPSCALQDDGLPCACGQRDVTCPHRRDHAPEDPGSSD